MSGFCTVVSGEFGLWENQFLVLQCFLHLGNCKRINSVIPVVQMHYRQGKTKGQQLKGKIVSEFFALFRTFSEIFPQDFPLQTKGFSSMRTKEKKRKKMNRTNRCCTLVVARLSSSYYRQRKVIFELIMHLKADTDTDKK